MYAKNFHASIKDFGICPNNPALEDSVIQNHFFRNFCACMQKTSTSLLRICVYVRIILRWKTCYPKSLLGISAHVRKQIHVPFTNLRICAKNPIAAS